MDKIIVIRGATQESSQLRVNGETGAVTDIHGKESLVSEFKLYDFLHIARLLGYEVEVIE